MHLVTRERTLIDFKSFPLNCGSRQSTERIEASEFQTAVIAEKFVQTRNLKNHQALVIAALNARTLTSRAPHDTYPPMGSPVQTNGERGRQEGNLSKSHKSPPNNSVRRAFP